MPRTDRYSTKQVAGMMVNPYVKGDIYEAYPWLQELAGEVMQSVNWDKFWRYVALVYDPASPMAKDYADVKMRKKVAIRDVDMLAANEEELRGQALQYLIRARNPEWTLICCNEMVFYDYAIKVTEQQEGKDMDALKAQDLQGKILAQMLTIVKTVKDLRKDFFGGDEELEQEARSLTPEQVARQTRK